MCREQRALPRGVSRVVALAIACLQEWGKELPDEKEADSFDQYVNVIEKKGTWAGALELLALGPMFDTRFIVYCLRVHDEPFVVHPRAKKKVVVLVYDGFHFDRLEASTGTYNSRSLKSLPST